MADKYRSTWFMFIKSWNTKLLSSLVWCVSSTLGTEKALPLPTPQFDPFVRGEGGSGSKDHLNWGLDLLPTNKKPVHLSGCQVPDPELETISPAFLVVLHMAWHAPASCLLSRTGVPTINLQCSLLISYCLLMCWYFSEDFVCKLYKPDLSWYKKKNKGRGWKWAGIDRNSRSRAGARHVRIKVAWVCCSFGVPINSVFLCWNFSNWNRRTQVCMSWDCRSHSAGLPVPPPPILLGLAQTAIGL